MKNLLRSLPYYSPDADDEGNFGSDSSKETSPKNDGGNSETKTDWEKAYKGLQRKYDILKQKYDKTDETISELETKVANLQIELESKDKSVNTTKANTDKLQQELQKAQDDLKLKETELARSSIVLKEFPDLGNMIDDLPKVDDPDKFRETLKNLKTTIDSRVEAEIKNRLKGTTVNDSEGPGNFQDTTVETLDTLYEKMIQYPAVRSPKQEAEYQTLNRKYLELVEKQ